MAKSIKLEHAKHNHDVCNFLSPGNVYPDWVITTAFYSAIHYVDHKLFPMKGTSDNGGKFSINCINEYRNINPTNLDKHSIRASLVRTKCAVVYPSFEWLRSASQTARYIDYRYPNPEQTIAAVQRHLAVISAYCEQK